MDGWMQGRGFLVNWMFVGCNFLVVFENLVDFALSSIVT